jgi:hypothetical protein
LNDEIVKKNQLKAIKITGIKFEKKKPIEDEIVKQKIIPNKINSN